MKFLLALVLLVFTISACSCAATMPQRVSYMENLVNTQAMRDGTAGLVDEDGLYCAGAFISQTEILTAEHCLSRPGHLEIVNEGGHPVIHIVPPQEMDSANVVTRQEFSQDMENPIRNSSVFNVVARDADRDLALLRANDSGYESAHAILRPPTASTQGRIVVGTETYAVGHPAGVPWNISHGFISTEPVVMSDHEVLVSSSQVFFGNSGGPLIDSNMNLIGICSGMPGAPGMGAATHVAFFISPNEIVSFLAEATAQE